MKLKHAYASIVLLGLFAAAVPIPAHAEMVKNQPVAVNTAWNGCVTNTWSSGVPDQCFYKDLQAYVLRQNGYTGAIDGAMGVNSWKAVQRDLNARGFNAGAVDGVPGYQTKTALQRMLTLTSHYRGPIDGILGAGTYRAWAVHVQGAMN